MIKKIQSFRLVMKALLLCAGYGTRLYPITKNKPKCLVEIDGKPVLDFWLKKN